jgi:hypothetical protein
MSESRTVIDGCTRAIVKRDLPDFEWLAIVSIEGVSYKDPNGDQERFVYLRGPAGEIDYAASIADLKELLARAEDALECADCVRDAIGDA